jgi:hypothetical protein
LPHFNLEELVSTAEVLHLHVHDGQAGGLRALDLEDGLGPGVGPLLAPVAHHLVLELAPAPDLQVVPGHEAQRLDALAAWILKGDAVATMVDDLLLRFGGQELQEAHLIAVRLVVDDKSVRGHVSDPQLLLLGDNVVLFGYRGLGLDAGGARLHVAVGQNGVLGIRAVGIDPVFAAGFIRVEGPQLAARLGGRVLVAGRAVELGEGGLELLVGADDEVLLLFVGQLRGEHAGRLVCAQRVRALNMDEYVTYDR